MDSINWRDCATVTLAVAAAVLGVSRPQLYNLATRGELQLVKIGGRTLVPVPSLVALADDAAPYVPDGTRKRGRAKALADAAAALT